MATITSDLEPIVAMVVDSNNTLLTGKTDIKIRIYRASDVYFFDWSDNTFKAFFSIVQLDQVLSEVNPIGAPGEYWLDKVGHERGFNLATVTNAVANDIYHVRVIQDGAGDAKNMPQNGAVRTASFTIVDKQPIVY